MPYTIPLHTDCDYIDGCNKAAEYTVYGDFGFNGNYCSKHAAEQVKLLNEKEARHACQT